MFSVVLCERTTKYTEYEQPQYINVHILTKYSSVMKSFKVNGKFGFIPVTFLTLLNS